jgi:hypothetical protein
MFAESPITGKHPLFVSELHHQASTICKLLTAKVCEDKKYPYASTPVIWPAQG